MAFEGVKSNESSERGKDVEIVFAPIRHGVREGLHLTDFGRKMTAEYAQTRGQNYADFRDRGAVKAIGSMSGPSDQSPVGMPRAKETAHIYAREIAGDEALTTRTDRRLQYDTMKIKPPYDHPAVYDPALEKALAKRGVKELKDLQDAEKDAVTHEAQVAVFEHIFNLPKEETRAWREENAGMFADMLAHYVDMSKRLNKGSRVLIPAGTHGGTMEWLLEQALVWKDEEGKEHLGISSMNEFKQLGGPFPSSDMYEIVIKRDSNGDVVLPLAVRFSDPKRPQKEMSLNSYRLIELTELFRNLHNDDDKRGLENLRMYK